ncbi:enoyl-CoA hydratase/isomerase family protein [Micromonospora profundi]|uniref:enoyl-CoA hydratase/isomerase family protein n=1 Tax=Micromonospora profundi TaxID=1420889 RepID=UPI0033B5CF25
MTAAVLVNDEREPLMTITLNRPSSQNRLEVDVVGGIQQALDRAEAAVGIRVLAIEAQGDHFCAGMALDAAAPDDWQARATAVRSLLLRLAESPLVTVALVNGAAIGGGVGLAAVCDHVIAGPGASFRMPEVLLGLIPALILPSVARRVGPQRAYSLALFADELSGRGAVEIGLADALHDDLRAALRLVTRRIRAADPHAVRALKRYYADRYEGVPGTAADPLPPALVARLADPGFPQRLAEARQAGLLR